MSDHDLLAEINRLVRKHAPELDYSGPRWVPLRGTDGKRGRQHRWMFDGAMSYGVDQVVEILRERGANLSFVAEPLRTLVEREGAAAGARMALRVSALGKLTEAEAEACGLRQVPGGVAAFWIHPP